MYTNTTQYLRALASDLVHGCRRTAADGTVIYTPDGTASYDGLWLRDFSYMVEYAGFAIPDQDIVNCIRYAVRHRRADGWMPDRVTLFTPPESLQLPSEKRISTIRLF